MSFVTIFENVIKVLQRYSMLFVEGTIVTLEYSAVAVAGGVVFGLLLAFMRRSICTRHTYTFAAVFFLFLCC